MEFETHVDVDATSQKVWEVVSDVENWPKWTKSMREVSWLDGAKMGVGSRARIRQPAMLPLVWQVSSLDPGRSFTWQTTSPGVKSVAKHRIEQNGGRITLTLEFRQTGPAAGFIETFLGKRTKRNIQMEAEGLKRGAESI
jgi:uncharacterized membrane protein